MLFLAAFAIGKHSAAALVHLAFLLLAPFGILASARRMGEPRAGVLASMLFYLAPVVAKDATSAYIDTGTAAVLIAAFYLWQVWRDDPAGRALVPAALLTGFAVACKITSASFFLYAFVSGSHHRATVAFPPGAGGAARVLRILARSAVDDPGLHRIPESLLPGAEPLFP
jgi:hypothetical protein